ncbi:unnamed protein product [Cuscuta europaea]|uniref:Uncharacterized protein n=1 Tax=Cuscuta europaea TaxID=41803 RepID=A0A9P0Z6J0_CUSEU|nr:unnamed protein product [Cuscuta europaea]
MNMERRRPGSHRRLEPPPRCCHGLENCRADHPRAFPTWSIDLRLGELLLTHCHRGIHSPFIFLLSNLLNPNSLDTNLPLFVIVA